MPRFAHEIARILNESSPYLLLGFALAGLLHVVMQRFPRATAALTRGGARSVFLASLIGLPMPLCSCGVLPAALSLRKNGATKGATAAFLISVPETDIVSILLTVALMGPLIGVFRPAAALVTAVVAGLLVNRIDSLTTAPTVPTAPPPTGEVRGTAGRRGESGAARSQRRRGWLAGALHFGFVEIFDDVIVQLAVGFVLAGLIVTWLPALGLQNVVGRSPLLYPAMLVLGVPVYVCATASTPLAAGLIAGGISPGAAMVFLLAGPATNAAGLLVLNKQLGARVLAGYLAAIAVCSVLAGALLDRIVGPDFTLPVAAAARVDEAASPIQVSCSVILAVLALLSIGRSKVIPLLARWRPRPAEGRSDTR
jgi:uncharacterized membrane protein YraQ (UPF0718 family)